MTWEKTATVSFVLAVNLLGLGACRGKSDSGQGAVNNGSSPGSATSDKASKSERDLNQAEIQKQIQEQTERSVQLANQQRQMMMQQMQTQRAQEQAVQNALQAQRQAQQATNAAVQARSAGQKH